MQYEQLTKQIIHLDDDRDMLRLVRHALSPKYNVLSLQDPRELINAVVRTGCRLIILDIDMGNTNGLDLLRTLKRLDGGIHVIMLTGLVSMETVLTSMRDGAEACLFKPLENEEELIDLVDDAVKKIGRWHTSVKDLLRRRRSHDGNRLQLPV